MEVAATRVVTADVDGALPEATCREICGPVGSNDTLLGCWTANLELAKKDRPRRLMWDYREGDDGAWRFTSKTCLPRWQFTAMPWDDSDLPEHRRSF